MKLFYLALSGLDTKQVQLANKTKSDGQGSSETKQSSATSALTVPSALKKTQRKSSDLTQPEHTRSTRKESPPAKKVCLAPKSSVKKTRLAKKPVAADSNLEAKVHLDDVDNNNGLEDETQVCHGKIYLNAL